MIRRPEVSDHRQQELNFELEDPNMSSGRIVQIIGAVIDVEFPRDSVPQVYDALKVPERELTLEVQQQLGDGVGSSTSLMSYSSAPTPSSSPPSPSSPGCL